MVQPDDERIERCLIELLESRAPSASICPSDVARSLEKEDAAWRALMPSVRKVAARLAEAGTVAITQGDRELAPEQIEHGPIRLRRGPAFPARR